jgi:hypothetical protein
MLTASGRLLPNRVKPREKLIADLSSLQIAVDVEIALAAQPLSQLL